MHQLQTLSFYLLNHHRQNLLLLLLLLRQEYKTRAILSFLRYRNTLQQDKLMRNLQHDACTIARLVACLCTSMLHIL